MALVIICYDVDSAHDTPMKDCLKKKGYQEYILSDNSAKCYLPNTTLQKSGISAGIGLSDMKSCASEVKARLERAISIEVETWKSIIGEPYRT